MLKIIMPRFLNVRIEMDKQPNPDMSREENEFLKKVMDKFNKYYQQLNSSGAAMQTVLGEICLERRRKRLEKENESKDHPAG